MSLAREEFDSRLLDLHLGWLGDAERAELAERMRSDAALAAEDEALRLVFAALSSDTAPAAPRDLNARIMARVRAAGAPMRVARERVEAAELGNPRIVRMSGLRDVLAVAATIVLAIGVGVPGVLHMKERSKRTVCAANLANLGQGMHAYATAFGASLPFGGWAPNDSWRPTSEPGVQVRLNRQHLYLLLRTGHSPVEAFVCPSAGDVPMAAEQVRGREDFVESRNISYAYQNMAGRRPQVGGDDPAAVVLGDDNPLFDNGRPLFEAAANALGLRDAAQANSRVHAGMGQNVLTLGGWTKWAGTPNAGPQGDNIWTLRQVQEYTGHEGPASATDSHLLK